MARKYDFKECEEGVLKLWDEKKVLENLKEKNKDGKKYYFLQGPPYTSGRLHMGHAWNNALKDIVLRLKRMQGFNVWDRAGYDMHGLPTELKVMNKFGMKYKEEIVDFGMDKFNDECRNFSIEMMKHMDTDLKRIGVTMNYDDSYKPIDDYFMEGEWALIKNANKNGRLYLGERTLSWCPECASALAKHEQEYKTVTDNSIFVKMKVDGKDNEYLVIWTTTPWTIPFNLAVMVNPELDYQKCKILDGDHKDEVWVVAKQLAGAFIRGVAGCEFEVVEDFKGEALEGVKYTHPFNDKYNAYKEIDAEKLHTVLMSNEFVDTSAGTGLVHCAPGCGPEDYEVGYRNGLPPFNNVNEKGEFVEEMGEFAGLVAKANDKDFIKALENCGALVSSAPVEHEYAHCWRHHTPVIFRTTKQWFLKTEDFKEKITQQNKDVHWVPKISSDQFDAWIGNLRDNSITKQRFWGNPAPIWVNVEDEEDYIVIGSKDELKEYVGQEGMPKKLHKPHIDSVVIKKDGKEYRRIPDVLDVWLDSGTAAWNCLYNNPELMDEWYPADFILEAKEQIRLWFYMLAICSELKDLPAFPFKNVYTHGMLRAVGGEKMSKSLGNIISPYEIIDKHGADTMRYYLCGIKAGQDISFSWDEVAQKQKNLNVLWNVHNFLIDFVNNNGFDISEIKKCDFDFGVEELFMLSKLNIAKKQVSELLEKYELDQAVNVVEELYLSLSRDYIKMVRDKSVLGSTDEKKMVAYVIYTSMVDVLKMLNIYAPFICENMYQNIKSDIGGVTCESVTHEPWITVDESRIDTVIVDEFELSMNVITATLAARERARLGVRWPVGKVSVQSDKFKDLNEKLVEVIKQMTNVKEIEFVHDFDISYEIKPNFKSIGAAFGQDTGNVVGMIKSKESEIIEGLKKKEQKVMLGDYEVDLNNMISSKVLVSEPFTLGEFKDGLVFLDSTRTPELEAEGFMRELIRRIQDTRKSEGLSKDDSIELYVSGEDADLISRISAFKDDMVVKIGAKELTFEDQEKDVVSTFKLKDKEFKISFSKL